MLRIRARRVITVGAAAGGLLVPMTTGLLSAQTTPSTRPDSGLEQLIARSVESSPAVRGAMARVAAATARVGPSSTPPDPMLMAGIINLPISRMNAMAGSAVEPAASKPDEMTMKMIGISQTILYPGKLSLERSASLHEVDAARAELEAMRRDITRNAKEAWYELVYLDHAFETTRLTSSSLAGIITETETRYSTGAGAQSDILKARIESARLSETANMILQQRRAMLAQLNAVLDRPSEEPIVIPSIPERLVRAALAPDAVQTRFTSSALGSSAADSPLPSVDVLQKLAVEHSPALLQYVAMTDAQTARLELSRKSGLPDFDVSLQYGQRTGWPDMVSATVSAPIRLHRGTREKQLVAEAANGLLGLHADQQARVNTLRAEVARLVSEIDRNRTQLALYQKAIIPQSSAATSSALASYQAGRVDIIAVLDAENMRFSYQLAYDRALSDFAINIAKLEQLVGTEVLQ
jgi:outer membrane protein TolC